MIFKKKNNPEKHIICGLEYIPSFYDNPSNRIHTLLLKGIILYCVSAGLVGGALSSAGSTFNHLIFNLVVVGLAVIVSLIYFNKLLSNICDVIYIFLFFWVGISLRTYINTGFYSWMNDIIGSASVYFDLDEIGGYAIRSANTTFSMTLAACYIASIVVIVVNLSIVRKMHFLDIVLDAILVLFLPAYLELEPDTYYAVILVVGIVICILWNLSGRYDKVDDQSVYTFKKKELMYNYNPKAVLQTIGIASISVIVTLFIIFSVLSVDNYSIIRKKSQMKKRTDEVVQIFITSGFAGFFNQYDSTGGVSSGRLGGIGSVRLDYKTDIEVTFVPYSFSPIYLRTFIASDYIPYDNRWSVASNTFVKNDEFTKLKNNYDQNVLYGSKGTMIINNIEGEYGEYYAYYSDRHSGLRRNTTYTTQYYPRFEDSIMNREPNVLTEDERAYWLSIPNDNRPTIMKITEELGLSQDMDELEIAGIIKKYYYDNIPYTLRPGATPWNRDFINYFLDKNKRGYCVHFASAATLMFRQMGIPARYVEGYAFDYNDVLEGEFLEKERLSDYYDGYSEITKVGVVKVNVLDANAHAWVEIFTDEYGWIPVELTPPSSDIDTNRESFLDRFFQMFNNQTNNVNTEDKDEEKQFDSTGLVVFGRIVLFIFIVIPVLGLIYFVLKNMIMYLSADINMKLLYRYRLFLFLNKRRFPDLSRKLNYNDSVRYICGGILKSDEVDEIIIILEKAGFSGKLITNQEFEYARKILNRKYKN